MPRKNGNYGNTKISLSCFYCTKCGKRGIDIPRKKGREREPGHLKKLYCLYCKSEQNMAEVRQKGRYTLEDFLIEFQNGNFENGQRKLPYRQFIAELRQKKEKEGMVNE